MIHEYLVHTEFDFPAQIKVGDIVAIDDKNPHFFQVNQKILINQTINYSHTTSTDNFSNIYDSTSTAFTDNLLIPVSYNTINVKMHTGNIDKKYLRKMFMITRKRIKKCATLISSKLKIDDRASKFDFWVDDYVNNINFLGPNDRINVTFKDKICGVRKDYRGKTLEFVVIGIKNSNFNRIAAVQPHNLKSYKESDIIYIDLISEIIKNNSSNELYRGWRNKKVVVDVITP